MDASLRRWYDIQTDNMPDEDDIVKAEKEAKAEARRARARARRRVREAALRSLGLTKCKSSSGKTLWE